MESDSESKALVPANGGAVPAPAGAADVVPALVAAAPRSSRRYLEFFAVTIENPNTRAAYFHACRRFFALCDAIGLEELVAIEPMHVAAYIRALGKDFEKPTVKQHLAAIRMLFDWLVVGTLENAQLMAAHESPRTTKLYDRTGDEITLDEVERIVI
jgi:site-specific recombinase XerD